MILSYNPNKIHIHCGWLEKEFFIWAEQKHHKKYQEYSNFQYPFLFSPFELKLALFKDHKPSFYGTFIETKTAQLLCPIKERMFYSTVGTIQVYQARPMDEHYLFPIEGVSLSIEELPQFLNSMRSWVHRNEFELSEDFYFWYSLFTAVITEIKSGSFLPSAKSTWELSNFNWSRWAASLPDSSLALYEARPKSLPTEKDKFKILKERMNDFTDVIIRSLIKEEPAVQHAYEALKAEKDIDLFLTKLELNEKKQISNQTPLLEKLGAVPKTPFQTGILITEGTHENSPWSVKLFIQDQEDPSVIVYLSDLQNGDHPWRTNPIPKVKRDLQIAKQEIPLLDSLSVIKPDMKITKEAAYEILTEQFSKLNELGITIIAPTWWKNDPDMIKGQIQVHSSTNKGVNQESKMNWQKIAEFDYNVSIGDIRLSEVEFNRLVKLKEPFIKINGKWIQWDNKQAEKLQEELEYRKNKMTYFDVWKEFITQDSDDQEVSVLLEEDFARSLQKIYNKDFEPIEAPLGLSGKLRPYQLEGVTWLINMRRMGFGACLADDMGLGKSIQTIAYILSVINNEEKGAPFLLICPTSLLGNWEEECRRFAPNLKLYIHHGAQRLDEETFVNNLKQFDLILTSYALAFRDEDLFTSTNWSGLILDEAQHVKNIDTKQRKSIRKIMSNHRIALTGTPMENRLKELWSIIDLLNNRYLGSYKSFHDIFVKPIEDKNNTTRLEQLQKLITPLILRRKKSDKSLALQLPEKQEQIYSIGLTVEQASLYQAVVNNLFETIETLNPLERKALILSSLTKLKQICNHPAQFLKSEGPLEGRSEKWELLQTLVDQILDRDEKVLIFTQYKEMGTLIQKGLKQSLSCNISFLHGSLERKKREEQINSFLEDKETKVFILSLKAGGVGLNLTAANHVIHYDRWWNPAVENQATDRAYRIGQTKKVTVHKFVTKGTLEDKINDLLKRKQQLTDSVLTAGEEGLTELSLKDLKELLTLTSE